MKHLVFYLFSGFLFAHNTVVNSAQVATTVYEEVPNTSFQLIGKHENRIFGNKLVVFYDQPKNTIYIGIRGTTKIQNWLSNAHIGDALLSHKIFDDFKKLTKSWFALAFEDLALATDMVLEQHPHANIVFTGHSYGGLMANLLAQYAYRKHPRLDFECHTFNAPGSKEIRTNTLKFKNLPAAILEERFFNHVRVTDLIGALNTHEGNVLTYEAAARFQHILEEHAMDYFAEDLEKLYTSKHGKSHQNS